MIRYLVVAILILSCKSLADIEVSLQDPAGNEGMQISGVTLSDEENKFVDLESLDPKQPFLFIPVYTHCPKSCPLLISKVKDVIKDFPDKDFRVVLFSFDPNDNNTNLKDFRNALRIPESWSLYRADPQNTAKLLDDLRFRFMTQRDEFIHPSVIVVLSPQKKIVKYIKGSNFTVGTLAAALREARDLNKRVLKDILVVIMAILAFSFGGLSSWTRLRAREIKRRGQIDKMSQQRI